MVKKYIEKRVLEFADYLISNRSTVRDTAKNLGYSKSTVHKDLTERLPMIDSMLARKVEESLDFNKAERHIQGGEATRIKYSGIKQAKKA